MPRAWLLTAAAVIVGWGTIGPVVRQVDLGGAAVAATRVWLATVVLGVVTALRPGGIAAVRSVVRTNPGRALLAGPLLASHWAALFESYQRAPVASVLFVVYLAPVGVALGSWLWLREGLGPSAVAALALGIAGAALVLGPGGDLGTGAPFALYAAISLVLLVLVSRDLGARHGGLAVSVVEVGGASIAFLPFIGVTAWEGLDSGWPWLALLGVVHTAGGLGLYLAALARLPATPVAVLGYLEPVSAAVFSWWLLDEALGAGVIVGGALILAAGVTVASGAVVERRREVIGVPR